jgi:hypothetical protein
VVFFSIPEKSVSDKLFAKVIEGDGILVVIEFHFDLLFVDVEIDKE